MKGLAVFSLLLCAFPGAGAGAGVGRLPGCSQQGPEWQAALLHMVPTWWEGEVGVGRRCPRVVS